MTRDSLFWWIGMFGSLAAGLAANFSLFPWIPQHWQHGIALVAFIFSIISGWMKTSPLPHSNDRSQE